MQGCADGKNTTIYSTKLNHAVYNDTLIKYFTDAIFRSEFASFVETVGIKRAQLCRQ